LHHSKEQLEVKHTDLKGVLGKVLLAFVFFGLQLLLFATYVLSKEQLYTHTDFKGVRDKLLRVFLFFGFQLLLFATLFQVLSKELIRVIHIDFKGVLGKLLLAVLLFGLHLLLLHCFKGTGVIDTDLGALPNFDTEVPV
jgi:uncharacterized membrane protein YkvI